MYQPDQPAPGGFAGTSGSPGSGPSAGLDDPARPRPGQTGSPGGIGLDGRGGPLSSGPCEHTGPGGSEPRGSERRGSGRPGGSGQNGFAGTSDALAAVASGLAFLARADAASLPVAEVADCLRELERAESAHTAARARMLAAFTAQAGYEADGHGGPKPWLIWQTRITRGAADGALGWARRLSEHPHIADALAVGDITESWARKICFWTDQLPAEHRAGADQILLGAGAGGADLADLSALFEEIYARCAPPDRDGDDGFTRRAVSLATHFQGAGKLDGNLTPECTAALQAVLESLGKTAGPEDDRTIAQRRHDALEEACRRLIASNGLPDVAGQAVQVQLHMTLDQLRNLPGAADAERAWRAGRAAEDGQPGWVRDPRAAEAYACDAQLAPMVTGYLDPAALAAMTDHWLAGGADTAARDPLAPAALAAATRDRTTAVPLGGEPFAVPRWTRKRLADTLLRYAADALSGPRGLASFLRTDRKSVV